MITRVRNGRTELVPPDDGYRSHEGEFIVCENDWHDNHQLRSVCPECKEICPGKFNYASAPS